jgi:hypothetical protein
MNVAALNSVFEEGDPSISFDGTVLHFASARPDGLGSSDLYRAVRVCD